MSDKIDDGDIILQEKIDISKCKTMFCSMTQSKQLRGELMLKALDLISNDKVKPTKNNIEDGSYFTWPTSKQGKEFRMRGYRLI